MVGASLRRSSAAVVSTLLRAASEPRVPTALSPRGPVGAPGAGGRVTEESIPVAACRYARMTTPHKAWVATPDAAKQASEAVAALRNGPGSTARAAARRPVQVSSPIPTTPMPVPAWILAREWTTPFHSERHLSSTSRCAGTAPAARSKSAPEVGRPRMRTSPTAASAAPARPTNACCRRTERPGLAVDGDTRPRYP
jgi:hypothetical protein